MITVSRSLMGTVSGALLVLAFTAFALSAIEPLFRPIAVGSLLLGGVAAIFLAWRARKVAHPTVGRSSVEVEDSRPIQPK